MNKTSSSRKVVSSPTQKLTLLLSTLSFLGLIGLLFLHFAQTPKVAYVKSDELINKYEGMLKARQEFQGKADVWQSNIDTLKSDLEAAMKHYEMEQKVLTSNQRSNKEQELRKQQDDLVRYTEAISKQAQEEDQKMTESILIKVNSFLETYGKDQGYDIIFGANGTGNIIYGVDARDITSEVLVALNKTYYGS